VADGALRIAVDAGPEAEQDELERVTRQLRDELLELPVDDIRFPEDGPAPPGAKGDVASIGELVVTLASGGVLPTLVGSVLAWLTRDRSRKVVIELNGDRLELSGASPEQQHALVAAWLDRHAGRSTNG
jgi:membrane-associated two-gene conflict system component 1 (EACC1)